MDIDRSAKRVATGACQSVISDQKFLVTWYAVSSKEEIAFIYQFQE